MAINDPEHPEKARLAQDVEEPPKVRSSADFHGGRGVRYHYSHSLSEGSFSGFFFFFFFFARDLDVGLHKKKRKKRRAFGSHSAIRLFQADCVIHCG